MLSTWGQVFVISWNYVASDHGAAEIPKFYVKNFSKHLAWQWHSTRLKILGPKTFRVPGQYGTTALISKDVLLKIDRAWRVRILKTFWSRWLCAWMFLATPCKPCQALLNQSSRKCSSPILNVIISSGETRLKSSQVRTLNQKLTWKLSILHTARTKVWGIYEKFFGPNLAAS